ncbi:MAG: glycosyltransferase family 39 protein [Candidatus Omnitrophica bacterium]|nr:glycosyltransferase family 39 protein [Candidatus Omnitrophota bacterium]
MDNSPQRNRNFIILGIIIAVLAGCIPPELMFPVLIVGLGLLWGLVIISGKGEKERTFLIPVFIISTAARIISAIFLFNLIYLSNGTGHIGDAWGYSANGGVILDLWMAGKKGSELIKEAVRHSSSGTITVYDFWNAIVYYITGKNSLSPVLLNCLAGSLTAIFIYDIAGKFYNKRAARIASLLTAFWPSLFFWSIQNLKEPISIFLITVLIWSVLNLKSKFRFYLLFSTAAFAAALKEFRSFLFYIFCMALLASLFFPFFRLRKSPFLYLSAAILLLFIVLAVPHTGLEPVKLFHIFEEFNKDDLSDTGSVLAAMDVLRRGKALEAGSAFFTLQFANPINYVLFGMPVMFLIAVLAPFPWMLGSMLQITAVPETILFYFLIPAIFLGGKYIITHKIKGGDLLIFYLIAMYMALGLTEGNAGTLFRHRAMALPFVFVLVAVGLSQRRDLIKGDPKAL